ncbi:Channel protein, major intrinsic protein family [Paracholeplasma brassicae]|uniref:Channel protein, major intrinsic protein family n=1 Tax=Acholeplasma brassicae TaxID=61635 RepID=U4KS14_9MOLU|nr:aquaporin [Paracholeplasma brassicae]CCV66238.1 Channel protein, major intrinsic protein family [Paracholeplasma brassicae]HBT59468.1 aquaporin [Acholeplasmataceae bacterium]
MKNISKALKAEFFGTLFLVLLGSIAALESGALIYAALGFGGTLALMAYIFGGHYNPAVSIGMFVSKRINKNELITYIAAQFVGALVASFFLALMYGFGQNIAANVVSSNVPGSDFIQLFNGLLIEAVLTFVFVLNILNITKNKENASIAPLVIGFGLVILIVVGGNLTGTSVNPVRSLAPAIFQTNALSQVWVYILGPSLGGLLAGLFYNRL